MSISLISVLDLTKFGELSLISSCNSVIPCKPQHAFSLNPINIGPPGQSIKGWGATGPGLIYIF